MHKLVAGPQRRKTVYVRSMEREKYLALLFAWKSSSSLHKGLVIVIAREVLTYGGWGCNSSREIDRVLVAGEEMAFEEKSQHTHSAQGKAVAC